MKDYYSILESSFNDTPEIIKNNYRRLCKKWHPDKNNSQDATKKMQEIIEAYEILGNTVKRKRYNDIFLKKEQYKKENNQEKYDDLEKDIKDAQVVAQSWFENFIDDLKSRSQQATNAAWAETKKQLLNLVVIIIILNLFGMLLMIINN